MIAPGKANQLKAGMAIVALALAALGGGAWLATRGHSQSASPGAPGEGGTSGAPDMAQGPAEDGAPAPAQTFADQRAWIAADESTWNDAPHEPAPIALAVAPWKSGEVPIVLPAIRDDSATPATPVPPAPPPSSAAPPGLSDIPSQRLWDPVQEAQWQAIPHALTTIALAQTPWSAAAARLRANKPKPAATPATTSASPRAVTTAPSGISTTQPQSR